MNSQATLVKSSQAVTPVVTKQETVTVPVENGSAHDSTTTTSMERVQQLISDKMVSLAEDLNNTTSATATRELLALIKECSETVSIVKNLS